MNYSQAVTLQNYTAVKSNQGLLPIFMLLAGGYYSCSPWFDLTAV